MSDRNGKIDKRALRDVALGQNEHEKATQLAEKLAVVRAEYYTASPYNSVQHSPTMPPPVYQSEASSSEKQLVFEKATVVEKESTPWDGYLDDEIPTKTQPKIVRNLRHQIFSLYRRLFGVVFVTNVAVSIATLVRPNGADAQHLGSIVVANLFCAILMRQDYVINAFFNTFCAVPASYVNSHFPDTFQLTRAQMAASDS